MRRVTMTADQWDIDENRAIHEQQWARDGFRVANVEPIANRHEYIVSLEPVDSRT